MNDYIDFSEDYEKEKKRKKGSVSSKKKIPSFLETVTVQAILCVSLAIVFLVLQFVIPSSGPLIKKGYQEIGRIQYDCWEGLSNLWNQAAELFSHLKPIKNDSSSITGAGGEPNPFGAYNRVMAPPDYATFAPVLLTSTISVPVHGEVTSPFGYRYHPVTGKLDFHKGTDIAAPYQTPIIAALDGVVHKSAQSSTAGNYIVLNHGNGLTSTYMHCSELMVKEGTRVREGEVIAKVGSTGISTGNHLHFQLEQNGIVFDASWVIPSFLLNKQEERK